MSRHERVCPPSERCREFSVIHHERYSGSCSTSASHVTRIVGGGGRGLSIRRLRIGGKRETNCANRRLLLTVDYLVLRRSASNGINTECAIHVT
jgi:hypothetical protein